MALAILAAPMATSAVESGPQRDPLRDQIMAGLQAWDVWMDNNPISSALTGCEEFHDLRMLGVTAVPVMVDMIASDPKAVVLGPVVGAITMKSFSVEEQEKYVPEEWRQSRGMVAFAHMYVTWWKAGRAETPRLFRQLHSRWVSLRHDGDSQEAERAGLEIDALGLDGLPFLMAAVRNGDDAAIDLVSFFTLGEVRKAANRGDVLKWWEENRDRWTLPASGGYDPRKTGIHLSMQDSTALPTADRVATDVRGKAAEALGEGLDPTKQLVRVPEDSRPAVGDALTAQRGAEQDETASANVEHQPGTEDARGPGWITPALVGGAALLGLGGWVYARHRRAS